MNIKQAVIPAAGLSTKFLPITKNVPKELLPLVDKPCLQHVIDEAVRAGVEEFIIVISNEKRGIEGYFKPQERLNELLEHRGYAHLVKQLKEIETKAHYRFVVQDEPLGLGHAVLCAEPYMTGDYFFVVLPDDIIDAEVPVLKQMADIFEYHKVPLVSVMSVPWEEVHRYGIVSADPISEMLGDIKNIVEKPARSEAPSNLAVIGRYLLPRSIFKRLQMTKPGADSEIQLTDALSELIPTTGLHAFTFKGTRYDTGTPLGLLMAELSLSLKHPEYREQMARAIKGLAVGL